jgi:hypothetical protein
MKTNNKNKSALAHHVPRIAPKRLFSLQLFIVIAIAIPCSLLVLFPGPRTDIVIWAAAFWMLIVGAGVVGAGATLTICYQLGWVDSMTVGGDGGGGC